MGPQYFAGVLQSMACSYRHGDGGLDGNASTYSLARQDLLRWYHVEGLRGLGLQQRYRYVHGVHAHRSHLQEWVEAQTLVCLENNEQTLKLPMAQWLLQSMQEGRKHEELVQELLLTTTTTTTTTNTTTATTATTSTTLLLLLLLLLY